MDTLPLRHFIVRRREHLGVNKQGKSIKGVPSSIKDHVNSTGHAASFEDFDISDKSNNNFDLLIHESLLILRDRPALNFKTLQCHCIYFNSPWTFCFSLLQWSYLI